MVPGFPGVSNPVCSACLMRCKAARALTDEPFLFCSQLEGVLCFCGSVCGTTTYWVEKLCFSVDVAGSELRRAVQLDEGGVADGVDEAVVDIVRKDAGGWEGLSIGAHRGWRAVGCGRWGGGVLAKG